MDQPDGRGDARSRGAPSRSVCRRTNHLGAEGSHDAPHMRPPSRSVSERRARYRHEVDALFRPATRGGVTALDTGSGLGAESAVHPAHEIPRRSKSPPGVEDSPTRPQPAHFRPRPDRSRTGTDPPAAAEDGRSPS